MGAKSQPFAKGPDGTRGFGMGRGKVIETTQSGVTAVPSGPCDNAGVNAVGTCTNPGSAGVVAQSPPQDRFADAEEAAAPISHIRTVDPAPVAARKVTVAQLFGSLGPQGTAMPSHPAPATPFLGFPNSHNGGLSQQNGSVVHGGLPQGVSCGLVSPAQVGMGLPMYQSMPSTAVDSSGSFFHGGAPFSGPVESQTVGGFVQQPLTTVSQGPGVPPQPQTLPPVTAQQPAIGTTDGVQAAVGASAPVRVPLAESERVNVAATEMLKQMLRIGGGS